MHPLPSISPRLVARFALSVALALLGIHAAVATLALRQQAVTLDEFGHLPAGISCWEKGAFFVYSVNPPPFKMLAALPVLARCPVTVYDEPFRPIRGVRQEWSLAFRFMENNREDYLGLFLLGRYPMVAVSVLGGWVLFLWARELFGASAGVVAVALWCSCPNILAYAGLITPDVGSAVGAVAAGYVCWRWLRRPTWRRAFLAGVVLGLAQLCKFTLLVLYPVVVVLWLASRLPAWRHRAAADPPLAPARQLGAVLALSVLILNMGYGFDGTGKRLGDIDFTSRALSAEHLRSRPLAPDSQGNAVRRYRLVGQNRFRGTWLGECPVPLPEHYLLGIDFQRRDFEPPTFSSYLRGEMRKGGWWYYYLYAMAVKLPLGTLALALVAMVGAAAWPSLRRPWLDELCWILPACAVLALVSSQLGFNEHVRYVLPVWPFLFLGISRVGLLFKGSVEGNRVGRWCLAAVVASSLAWNVGSAARAYPHYLSYFNEAAGGPDNGGLHLINSNLDWGQDLLFLRRWLDAHPEARPLGLAYFNFVDPSLAGIAHHLPPILTPTLTDDTSVPWAGGGPKPGWHAVSANYVYGLSFQVYDGKGARQTIPEKGYTYFQLFRPVAKAGYSIFIYRITFAEANEARAKLGLPALPPDWDEKKP